MPLRVSPARLLLVIAALLMATTTAANAHGDAAPDTATPLGPPPPADLWPGAGAAQDQLAQDAFDRAVELAPVEVRGECVATDPLPGVGEACRTVDGLLRVPLADGTELVTHGPDFLDAATDIDPATTAPHVAAAVQAATKQDITCVPTSTAHVQVIYAIPTDAPDRSAQQLDALRQSVYESSAVLDNSARMLAPTQSRQLRVACDVAGDADVQVLRLPHTASQLVTGGMSMVRTDLQALRGGEDHTSAVRYLVYYDAHLGSFAGIGSYWEDTDATDSNKNNGSLAIAIQDDSRGDGPSWHVLLHELTHNMGAVLVGSPDSNSVGHCNDGRDVMCYDEQGTTGFTGTYSDTACAELQYDCGADTYFNPTPIGGSWLATHWNVASTGNRYLAATTVAADTTVPAQVTGVTATGHGDFIRMSWDPVAAPDLHTYRVERDLGGGTWITVGDAWPGDTSLDATWAGIPTNTSFDLRVRAYDRRGNLGTPSDPVTVDTADFDAEVRQAPGPELDDPTQLVVTSAAAGTVSLAWTSPQQNGDYVDIERWTGSAWQYHAYVSASSTTATVTGLPGGGPYRLRVRANTYPEGRYSPGLTEVTATVGAAAPTAPTGVAVASSSGTIPTVSWNAVGGAAAYRITTSPATQTTYTTNTTAPVPGIAPGAAVTVQVAALSGSGAASTAGTASFTAPAQGDVAPPTAPTITACSGSTTRTTVPLSWTTQATDDVAVTGYRVLAAPASRPWDFGRGALLAPSATSGTVGGLVPGTAYQVYVEAYDAAGHVTRTSSYCPWTTRDDTANPSQPGTFTATSSGATSIDLAWAASTDDSAVASYRVYRTNPGGEQLLATVSHPTTSFAVTGLTGATTYSFAIEAVDVVGKASTRATASATTANPDAVPPSAPGAVSVGTITGSSVALSWGAATDDTGVTGYEVRLGSAAGMLVGTTALTSFTVTSLTDATTYTFAVVARDAAGNRGPASLSGAVTTPDVTAPAQVGAITIGSVTGSGFTASWSAPADNVAVTGYEVALDGASRGTQVASSWVATGLTDASQYAVTVRARDAAGNWGPWSAAKVATTLDATPPAAPTGLAAATTDTSVQLTWSASTDNVATTAYRVYAAPATLLGTVTAPTRTYTATGFTASSPYDLYVTALDAAGNESTTSAHATGTTKAAPDTTAPSAPGVPTSTGSTTTSISLTWSAATDDSAVDHYQLTRVGGATVDVAGTSATVSGLTANTTYTFTVRAVDLAGNVGAAAQGTAATQLGADTTAPSVPAGPLTSSASAAGIVGLAWGASSDDRPGTITYLVLRNTGTGGWQQVASTTGTSIQLTGQPTGVTVQYGIAARDAAGNTSAFLAKAIDIPAPPPPLPAAVRGLAAVATTRTIAISWQVSDDAPNGYRVTATAAGGTTTITTTATTAQLGPYAPRTAVHVEVAAIGSGGAGAAAAIDTATTADRSAPTRPGGLRAKSPARGKLAISWTRATDDIAVARYELRITAPRQRTVTATIPGIRLTTTISRLRPRTRYTVQLRAVDAAGNASPWATTTPIRTR